MQDVGIFDKDLLIVDRSLDVQDFDFNHGVSFTNLSIVVSQT